MFSCRRDRFKKLDGNGPNGYFYFLAGPKCLYVYFRGFGGRLGLSLVPGPPNLPLFVGFRLYRNSNIKLWGLLGVLPYSVLLTFSQSYIKHDLRKNKIVVSFFC
jgi:hypothetical protein